MWQAIEIIVLAIIFAIGIAIIVLPISLVILNKKQKLEKYNLDEDKSYLKIYNQRLTTLGKLLLVVGIFLTIIAITWLLFII